MPDIVDPAHASFAQEAANLVAVQDHVTYVPLLRNLLFGHPDLLGIDHGPICISSRRDWDAGRLDFPTVTLHHRLFLVGGEAAPFLVLLRYHVRRPGPLHPESQSC